MTLQILIKVMKSKIGFKRYFFINSCQLSLKFTIFSLSTFPNELIVTRVENHRRRARCEETKDYARGGIKEK